MIVEKTQKWGEFFRKTRVDWTNFEKTRVFDNPNLENYLNYRYMYVYSTKKLINS